MMMMMITTVSSLNSCVLFQLKTLYLTWKQFAHFTISLQELKTYCIECLPKKNQSTSSWLWLLLTMNDLCVWGHALALVQQIPPSPSCLDFLPSFRLMLFPPTPQRCGAPWSRSALPNLNNTLWGGTTEWRRLRFVKNNGASPQRTEDMSPGRPGLLLRGLHTVKCTVYAHQFLMEHHISRCWFALSEVDFSQWFFIH